MNIEQKIREYLAGVIHMSLATSANNQPWVCEVHFAYDQDLNLYFCSKTERRHSKEISQNNNVAGNIIEQHILGQKPRGVYFEGVAELLMNVDMNHPAFLTYDKRFDVGLESLTEAMTEEGHKFYKITVNNFYLFDSRESTPSMKYKLPWRL